MTYDPKPIEPEQPQPLDPEPEPLFVPIEVDQAQRDRMMTGRVDHVGQ